MSVLKYPRKLGIVYSPIRLTRPACETAKTLGNIMDSQRINEKVRMVPLMMWSLHVTIAQRPLLLDYCHHVKQRAVINVKQVKP